jgi:hypothetical protein
VRVFNLLNICEHCWVFKLAGLCFLSPRGKTFHLDGPRKKNVVLEMDVLMQVLLEFPQTVVKRMKGRAGNLPVW